MFLHLLAAVMGAAVVLVASQRAVRHGIALARVLRVPPFLVGTVLFSLGTDVSEFVHSIVAALSGHGDIAAGDAIGSVFTQSTFVLGVLPFVVRKPVVVDRSDLLVVSGLTLAGLGVAALLLRDGAVSRVDAAVLIAAWAAAMCVLWTRRRPEAPPKVEPADGSPMKELALGVAWLLVIAAGAASLVHGLAGLAAALGVPEYVLAFLGASFGTSLPELMVDITALRRGQVTLALGDLFGSCLVDATLSLGIGPAVAPTTVDAGLALQGVALAAAGMLAAAAAVAMRPKLDRLAGVLLLVVYAAAYVWLLAAQ